MIVAVLGKNGLLGSDLVSLLSGIQGIELLAFDREEIDITDSDSLRDFFENRSPDFIFNAAAYTNVDDCERNHDLALRVNAAAPASIAEFCNKNNARLVHFSTDYVFDGQNESGYRENDVPSPINAYGLSKLRVSSLFKIK